MELIEAVEQRHSVRSYTERPIDTKTLDILQEQIETANQEGDLRFQLVRNNPVAFKSVLAKYGHFENVHTYICCVGKKEPNIEQRIGYYGQRIVLNARTMGIDSCWVAGTYNKRNAACAIFKGEKLYCVIALGYGKTHGSPRKSKPAEKCFRLGEGVDVAPAWFTSAMNAAMLAPTAMNRQDFVITLEAGNVVKVNPTSHGSLPKIDIGIVKCNFEIGAGDARFAWSCS